MARTTAVIATESGWRYVQQLCKHWAHKLDVALDDDLQTGTVRFPEAVATMTAGLAGLTVTIEAASVEQLEIFKGVVASHLDRFAFREAPLPFAWTAG